MKTKIFLALLALVLALAPKAALADITITFNGDAPGPPGTGLLYMGSGNPDGDFTTATASFPVNGSSISLSLRGAIAYGSVITPTNNTEYDCTGALCSFQWSVFTQGFEGFNIDDFTYSLAIHDLNTNTSGSFDPSGQTAYSPLLDDDYWVNGAKVAHMTNGTTPYQPTAVGFENSEQFVFFGISPADELLVTLSAEDKRSGAVADSVTIGFNTPAPVPEPSAIVLTLTMAGFLGFNRLRRRRRQQV